MNDKISVMIICFTIGFATFGCSDKKDSNKITGNDYSDDLWYKEIIEESIANGEDLNMPLKDSSTKSTHLHEAAKGNYIESAKLLLSKDVDIDPRNSTQATPLHRAAYNGNIEIAKFLIRHGADVNARDHSGCTPLYNTALSSIRSEEMVNLLLASGGDINIRNDSNATFLRPAAYSGNLQAMELFIAKGMDVNAVDNKGYTALHLAAWYGHYNVVEILLENGAEVNIIADGQRSPLDCALISLEKKYASPSGKRKCVNLLKKHGGKKASELNAAP